MPDPRFPGHIWHEDLHDPKPAPVDEDGDPLDNDCDEEENEDQITCCYGYEGGCEAPAKFYIHHGPSYEDGTFSCRAHLGEMVVANGMNIVQPAAWHDDPAVPPITNTDWTRKPTEPSDVL
jgi:hypothetical protein